MAIGNVSDSQAGIDLLLKWETHPSRTLYSFHDLEAKRPRYIFHPKISPIPEGASGWFIGEQNGFGYPMYMAGVRVGDERIKEFGKEVMLAGGKRQTRVGGFPMEEDVHHSAAFFFEAVARLVLLGPKTQAGDLMPFCKNLRYGGQWFAGPGSWQDGWLIERMNHRFFLNSAVLYLADAALRSMPDNAETQWIAGPLPDWCRQIADTWLLDGMRLQRADGAITEGIGHDTGYHSLAITFMTGTLMTADLRPELRESLTKTLKRAAAWLLTRIRSNGSIDYSGNTRMMNANYVPATERFGNGSMKGIKYYETAFALQGAGLQLNNDDCLSAVERIMKHYTQPTEPADSLSLDSHSAAPRGAARVL